MKVDVPHAPVSAMRVALFVDGENLSHTLAEEIVSVVDGLGGRGLRRVYGDATRMTGWRMQGTLQIVDSAQGKNAADLLLSIEAMEAALVGGERAIAIASGDRDFSHLARKLAEHGVRVIGIGSAGPDCGFRKACSDYRNIGKPGISIEAPAGREIDPGTLTRWIETVIGQADGQRVSLSSLGKVMRERHCITKADLPTGTWKTYLAEHPRFEVDGADEAHLAKKKPAQGASS